ncbi:CBS-domain-containing membrane protein [Sporocytophaga myxococcoides]|uniref:CBS-domain-containing membrane protein n=2 Tax=Sporocytophaga myxococcoides TaxID=153721 RepID=A0A098LKG2_9BACT|nr:CBS-domain-containing membrane protein [Sporocytophaga myxococcoides]
MYRETMLHKSDLLWTFLGSFCGIGLIGLINSQIFEVQDHIFLIGSFGASAVLLYGVSNSPLSQPRNLFGGHILSAIVGVTTAQLLPDTLWFASTLAVSLSIMVMQMTKTLHPPGGATALIANIGSAKIKELGYWYVVSPVASGVIILFLIAMVFNNLSGRKYPLNKGRKRRVKSQKLKVESQKQEVERLKLKVDIPEEKFETV